MGRNDEDERYFTSSGEIYGVFRALQKERCSINLQFPDKANFYSSLVVDCSLKGKYVLLDEIPAVEGHREMEAGIPFSLHASINGIQVYCKDLRADNVSSNENGILYRVPFPARLLYLQRRDAYRVPVTGTEPVEIAFALPDDADNKNDARLVNLSATGFRMEVAGNEEERIQQNDVLHAVLHIVSQDQRLSCRAQVMHRQHDSKRNVTVFGCCFLQLQRSQQMLLNRFVTYVQRSAII